MWALGNSPGSVGGESAPTATEVRGILMGGTPGVVLSHKKEAAMCGSMK